MGDCSSRNQGGQDPEKSLSKNEPDEFAPTSLLTRKMSRTRHFTGKSEGSTTEAKKANGGFDAQSIYLLPAKRAPDGA